MEKGGEDKTYTGSWKNHRKKKIDFNLMSAWHCKHGLSLFSFVLESSSCRAAQVNTDCPSLYISQASRISFIDSNCSLYSSNSYRQDDRSRLSLTCQLNKQALPPCRITANVQFT